NPAEGPNLHCTHAGPTGDGHCGASNCESYCELAGHACPAAFAEQFGSDAAAQTKCQESCGSLEGAKVDTFRDRAQRYSVSPPPAGNTVLCRTYHSVAALMLPLNDMTECKSALGLPGSACQ